MDWELYDNDSPMLSINGVSAVAYDSSSLVVCDLVGDVPWLSTNPSSGATLPGESSTITVNLDGTGMALGTYTATLCAANNDPLNPIIAIPASLIIVEEGLNIPIYLPLVFK